MALDRLLKAGTIRRVIRGVYDYPRYSELLKQPLAPNVHEVAHVSSGAIHLLLAAGGALVQLGETGGLSYG